MDSAPTSPGGIPEFSVSDLFLKEIDVDRYFGLNTIQSSFQIENVANHSGFNKQITSGVEKATGLLYAGNNQPGNVCFANNNEDLRDEFKLVFSTSDLIHYILGVLKTSAKPIAEYKIPYPVNAENFWKLVRLGNAE